MPTVLVVEDEPLIRELVVEELTSEGFSVVEARDADQAIAILEVRDDIRLVFTDVDMPGSMNGIKLAAAVRDRWPPIHIVITSGKSRPPRSLPTLCSSPSPTSSRPSHRLCALSRT